MESAPYPAFFKPAFAGIPARRPLPDLGPWVAEEPYVQLLFDERSGGDCLLAWGGKEVWVETVVTPDLPERVSDFVRNRWTFGWLGYDLKNAIEDLRSARPDDLGFPVVALFEPRILLRWGASTGGNVEVLAGKEEVECSALREAILQAKPRMEGEIPPAPGIAMKPRWDASKYRQRVARAKKHIQQGDIYEINLCAEWSARKALPDPWGTFVRLQDLTRAPFGGFTRMGACYALCGSPERFLQRSGDLLRSQPIKGTVRRSEDPDEDRELAAGLASSAKERAENVMIVDLVRNDLSRVAAAGSVHVPELCGIHTFRTVHQMISTVECRLQTGAGLADVLRATFPMGSMTGAPKIRAMQIIDDLESNQRGLYSGTMGYFAPNGDFDLNVMIRSIFYHAEKGRVSLQVGGAITALSDAEAEWQECNVKARSLLETLQGHG
jgi:para-aminobenzoate synthetase component 1